MEGLLKCGVYRLLDEAVCRFGAVADRQMHFSERGKSREHFDRGSVVQALAALLWLPQAGLLAYAVQGIASGAALRSSILIAAAVLLLGICRSLLEGYGVRLSFREARARLSMLRDAAIVVLGQSSPLDIGKPVSGQAASVVTEQAEAITPYLARYQPARFKCLVVPAAILLAIVPFTWLIAIILLIAATLIPLFMALIGWRAKEASEEHLAEMGGMNGFLLDRLRGLATIRSLDAVDLTARRLRTNAEALRRQTMAVLRIAFLSSAVLELFAALGVAMVAVFIGFHLLGQINFGTWGERLTLGQGLFVILLAPAFFDPLRELSAVWHDRAAGLAAMEAMEDLAKAGMPLPAAFDEGSSDRCTSEQAPEVQLRSLTFTYPAAERAAFVESFEAEYGRIPSLYASQGFDTANLILSALASAPVSDADAFRAALEAADFESVRGDFEFNTNHHPIQDIYVREVVDADGTITNRIVGLALEDRGDAFAEACRM